MSWSIEEHIGEGRPWPEQVVVYRGETDESLTYARRSLSDVNKMVELMDTLAAENARLRELAVGMYGMLEMFDKMFGNHDACETPRPLIFGEDKSFKDVMRELGVEAE